MQELEDREGPSQNPRMPLNPMSMQARINDDLKTAMKAGDALRRDTLRSIRAAVIEAERKGTLHELTEDEMTALLNTAVKRRKETIESLVGANRPELVAREQQELAIIMEYLPAQLDDAAVGDAVASIIAKTGATGPAEFGKVMGLAMKELKGKADGGLVQRIVKERLGS